MASPPASESTDMVEDPASSRRYFPHTTIEVPDAPFQSSVKSSFQFDQGKKRKWSSTGIGRPLKDERDLKRPRYDPRSKKTKLRVNHKVKTEIPSDVWYRVFTFTDPETLWRFRDIGYFHDVLSKQTLWREVRLNHFGPDCPPPPAELSEAEYVNLLEGHGCMDCGSAKTKKAQWAFLGRWCVQHFRERVYKKDEAALVLRKKTRLLECLPSGAFDARATYTGVWHEPDANRRFWGAPRLEQVYLKKDVEDLIVKLLPYSDELSNSPGEEAAKTFEDMKNKTQLRMMEAKRVEDFLKEHEAANRRTENNKLKRIAFFREKALSLDPPLQENALKLVPGYENAIAKNSQPTDRSWRALLQNILKYRGEVEEEAESVSKAQSLQRRVEYVSKKERSKAGRPGDAQAILNQLFETAFDKVVDDDEAPEDMAHLILRQIWEGYHSISRDSRPKANDFDMLQDPMDETYVLCMDDALRMIGKIQGKIRRKTDDDTAKRAINCFKCPACLRKDYSKEYNFRALFIHLRKAHAPKLGSPFRQYHLKYEEFGCAEPFHWRAIAWPRNLPMLAPHHNPTGRWDPDDAEYTKAPDPTKDSEGNDIPSAFERRVARQSSPMVVDENLMTANSLRPSEQWLQSAKAAGSRKRSIPQVLASAISMVQEKLSTSPLPKQYKGMIAWMFATQTPRKVPIGIHSSATDFNEMKLQKLQLRRNKLARMLQNVKEGKEPGRFITVSTEGHLNWEPLRSRSESQKLILRPTVVDYDLSCQAPEAEELVAVLAQTPGSHILDGFSCKQCASNAAKRKFRYEGRHGVAFTQLVKHFCSIHQVLRFTDSEINMHRPLHWKNDMLHFPSSSELKVALEAEGCETAKAVFEELFPIDPDWDKHELEMQRKEEKITGLYEEIAKLEKELEEIRALRFRRMMPISFTRRMDRDFPLPYPSSIVRPHSSNDEEEGLAGAFDGDSSTSAPYPSAAADSRVVDNPGEGPSSLSVLADQAVQAERAGTDHVDPRLRGEEEEEEENEDNDDAADARTAAEGAVSPIVPSKGAGNALGGSGTAW